MAKQKTSKQVVNETARKITTGNIKGIFGKKADDIIGKEMILAGRIVGTTAGETDFGPFTKLRGSFLAEIETEEVIVRTSAPVAILPVFISEQLEAAFADSESSVEFAIVIGAKESDSPTGYEWIYRNLVEVADDPLQALLEQGKQNLLKG